MLQNLETLKNMNRGDRSTFSFTQRKKRNWLDTFAESQTHIQMGDSGSIPSLGLWGAYFCTEGEEVILQGIQAFIKGLHIEDQKKQGMIS